MPKQNIDFSKTVIYKIQHKEIDDLLYVGSTINFTQRKHKHKSSCYNDNSHKYNYKLYQTIRDNGGWDMFDMVIIKPFPCQNFNEARTEEDKLMREMKSNLNMIRAYQTPEERVEYFHENYLKNKDRRNELGKIWKLENKDKIKKRSQEYYMETIDKRKETNKKWRLENKDKRKEHYLENKDKIKEKGKQYRLENKDKIKEQNKKWRLENTDKIKQYRLENKDKIKEKFECPCGGKYTHENKSGHFKTMKHQNFLKNNP